MVIYIDLHHHSTVSDGVSTPELVAKLHAEARNVVGQQWYVILTDHDNADGQKQLLGYNDQYNITFNETYALEKTNCAYASVNGSNITVHFNVFCPFYFTSQEVPCEIGQAIEWAHSNGCLVQLNHPALFNIDPRVVKPLLQYVIDNKIDMIEVGNANELSIMDWSTYLSLKSLVYGNMSVLLDIIPIIGLGRLPSLVSNLDENQYLPLLTANTDSHFPAESMTNGNISSITLNDPPSWDDFHNLVKNKLLAPAWIKRAPIRYRVLHYLRFVYPTYEYLPLWARALMKVLGISAAEFTWSKIPIQ